MLVGLTFLAKIEELAISMKVGNSSMMLCMYIHLSVMTFAADALFELLMKMVVEPVPPDNELAAGKCMCISEL